MDNLSISNSGSAIMDSRSSSNVDSEHSEELLPANKLITTAEPSRTQISQNIVKRKAELMPGEEEIVQYIVQQVLKYNNLCSYRAVDSLWKSITRHLNKLDFGSNAASDCYTSTDVKNMWNRKCRMHPNSDIYVPCQAKTTTDMHVVVYLASTSSEEPTTIPDTTIHATSSDANANYIARCARDWYRKYLYQQPLAVYKAYSSYLGQRIKHVKARGEEYSYNSVSATLLSVVFAVELTLQTDTHVSEHTHKHATREYLHTALLPPVHIDNLFTTPLPKHTLPKSHLHQLWVAKQSNKDVLGYGIVKNYGLIRTGDGIRERTDRTITLSMLAPIKPVTSNSVPAPVHLPISADAPAPLRSRARVSIPGSTVVQRVPAELPVNTLFSLDATPCVLITNKESDVTKKQRTGEVVRKTFEDKNSYW